MQLLKPNISEATIDAVAGGSKVGLDRSRSKVSAKVLVIAYSYPPVAGVGVLRTLGFTRYLPEFGWEPYVLTVKNPDKHSKAIDHSQRTPNVKTYRARNILKIGTPAVALSMIGINPRIFLLPDIYLGWIPAVVRAGRRLIREEDIDCIYVSCPPHSSAIAGAMLRKSTGKPLILDFRDEWTLCPYTRYPTKLHRLIDEKIEHWVLNHTDELVGVSRALIKGYVAKYPLLSGKTTLIYNGFEEVEASEHFGTNNAFIISYAGSVFTAKRQPTTFFDGLRKALEGGAVPRESLRYDYVGSSPGLVWRLARDHGLEGVVNVTGQIPYKEAQERIYSSDLLLLVAPTTEITSKVFEYLASGKPILALVGGTELADLVRGNSDNSYVMSFDSSPATIAEAIVDAYNKWKEGQKPGITSKTIQFRERFNRRRLTEELAEVLEKHV